MDQTRWATVGGGAVLAVVIVALLAGFALTRSASAPTADTTAPELRVLAPEPVSSYRAPIVVRGTAIDAARVSIGDESVTPASDGAFELSVPWAPAVEVVAVDAAGNRSGAIAVSAFALPRLRAVHVTAHAWSHEGLREGVLAMAREGRIDTVQLDIKDEDGVVGYDSQVPLARESGAVAAIYDAQAALRQLHELGVQVVGRIVAFRDPSLAAWAWHSGRPDWVVQNPSGQPYSSHYGPIAFTNVAQPEVRRYNIDLAVEAARLGFDGIMYDYVRRPDGNLSSMRFAGLTDSPTDAVVGFVAESRYPVHAAGAHLSAAVYGIAATRPDQIAQDIPRIARHVDYVAPMVYPSHWNPGEYGVANPNAQPYDITLASLRDFQTTTAPTGAKVIPWLQDFTLGVPYGDPEVRAQIDATRAAGIESFFLWNAATRYHPNGIPPA
ncbi:putative glycoside hydrolase [Nocardia asteroides]|uniref:putative glycoside hydrolase n=1 Tax=Nocardia asteroides TaxID=1824 RepID=UPI001E579D2C|nr:putative glycoside hydrolase [Nocardia asteroides]UGT57091.1 putative glycoside hydrolase [Nocardia asteroides]